MIINEYSNRFKWIFIRRNNESVILIRDNFDSDIDLKQYKENMRKEFRFSFMEPKKIETETEVRKVLFKSNHYLFHGIEYQSNQEVDSLYMQKSRRYKGLLIKI